MLVMSKGACAEYDHPFRLLVENEDDTSITKKSGHFAEMVAATGPAAAKELFEIARNKYLQNRDSLENDEQLSDQNKK